MKLVVGFPLSYNIPTSFFQNWLHMDHSHVFGAITATGVYVDQNMEVIVENALQLEDWDRLLIFEHDMVPPVNAFNRVALYQPEHHIVGSMYFARRPPYNAMALIEQPDCMCDPISPQTVKDWCDDPQLYQVDAVGLGFTSIIREVLVNWDKSIPMFHTDQTFGSHDLWFCHYARKQGYRVFVDSGMLCDHLGETPISVADNQRLASTLDSECIVPFVKT